jgi:hypothetical protein
MQLPGGLWKEGQLQRDFAFKPPTGAMELALQTAATSDVCRPDQISEALLTALLQLGESAPTLPLIVDLAVGDRQFLMRRLGEHLGLHRTWLTTTCRRCQTPFDFFVDQGQLPVKAAGEGFPFAQVDTSRGALLFRVPNGGDQTAIAFLKDPQAMRDTLVCRSLVAPDGLPLAERQALVAELSNEDFVSIEQALEVIAPEVTTEVQVACSECQCQHRVAVDPYAVLERIGTDLDEEIHTIAATYHWSEAEILNLTISRRRRYLALIDRARGVIA